MNALKVAGIAIVAGGILGMVYGSFSFTEERHEARIGPIESSANNKQTVKAPVWAGVGAIVIGGALLVISGKGARQRPRTHGGRPSRRRFKSEPPRRFNIEPGVEADLEMVGCGQV